MNPTEILLRDLDPLRGGRAELTIDPPEILPARLSVSIRRGSASRSFLGPEGWQQSEHLFPAASFEEAGGRLVLTLGPEVVDNELRDYDVVEITFPEVGMIGQVVWEGITRSIALDPEAAKPQQPQSPRPAVNDDETGTRETPPPPPPPLPGTDDDPAPGPVEPNRLPLIVGGLILLLAAAGGGYWFLNRGEPTPIVQDDSAAIPPPAPPTDPLQAAHERGLAALEAGDCEKARQELAPALDGGYGPTLLLWAERQDSVDFQPCLVETSNDIRALANYQKACEAGTPDVAPALQALIEELKRRAGQGDAVAEDVLRVAAPKTLAACPG